MVRTSLVCPHSFDTSGRKISHATNAEFRPSWLVINYIIAFGRFNLFQISPREMVIIFAAIVVT